MANLKTLNDVTEQLNSINKTNLAITVFADNIASNLLDIKLMFESFLMKESQRRYDQMESNREKKDDSENNLTNNTSSTGQGMNIFNSILGGLWSLIKPLASLVGYITGFGVAIMAATMGLTGFKKLEFSIIEKLGAGMKNLSKGVLSLISKPFLWANELLKSNKIYSKIASSLNEGGIKLIESISNFFNKISAKLQFGNLLNSDLFKRVTDFIETIKGKVGGILKVFGKILRPIAAIMSVIDGFNHASEQMKDETGWKKWVKGGTGFIGGTIGSFIGELINFLKDLPLWVIGKMFPGLIDKDGKFKTDTWIGKTLNFIDGINFNTIITTFFDGLGAALTGNLEWFTKKIDDLKKWVWEKTGLDVFKPDSVKRAEAEERRKKEAESMKPEMKKVSQLNKQIADKTSIYDFKDEKESKLNALELQILKLNRRKTSAYAKLKTERGQRHKGSYEGAIEGADKELAKVTAERDRLKNEIEKNKSNSGSTNVIQDNKSSVQNNNNTIMKGTNLNVGSATNVHNSVDLRQSDN